MVSNVVEWLQNTAIKMPGRMALWDSCEQLTYSQYYGKSMGIARSIIDSGTSGGKPVAVYMQKSVRMPVAFMGIAASGNFYSPIDEDMPSQRINKIMDVLKPEIVVTTKKLYKVLLKTGYSGKAVIYEDAEEKQVDEQVFEAASRVVDTDLLYVLFTSGSTGMPKGVCITHRGVIDFIDWVTEKFGISKEDRFANQAPFYFDNSILDIYSCLRTGACMYIVPGKLFAQPVRLLEFLKEKQISTVFWVPSALMVVSRLKALQRVCLKGILKRVLFCGEVMPNRQLNIWRAFLPDALYANLYGPTEITDACTCYIVDRAFTDEESLPIGFPMKNTDILVLDAKDRPVTQPGQTGELCVRGTGVSPGYYNDPERTRSVFVQNPLNLAYEEKIYRTGDLVQYNSRRELIYLSRKDFQIKHMGHRIELGEIEAAASSMEGVTMCCCLYDEDKGRILLFLDKDMGKEEVHARLRGILPEYMLPGRVVYLENLPLNTNGKIDRRRLREWV